MTYEETILKVQELLSEAKKLIRLISQPTADDIEKIQEDLEEKTN